MDERAVSDVLGFILIFSLISLVVAIVSLSGFAGIQERQDAEQVNNAEQAFEILADNIEDLHLRGAPRRSTEIELAGAQLSSTESTTVEVTITNLDPVVSSPNVKVLNPIEYTAPDGTTLVYENGAVIREDPNGAAVMKHEPNLVFSDRGDTALLPIIATSQSAGFGGETTALIQTESGGSVVLDRYSNPASDGVTQYNVRLRITTSAERAIAWWRYLDEEIEEKYGTTDACGTSPPTGDTVVCTISVDQVSITSTRIDVRFS